MPEANLSDFEGIAVSGGATALLVLTALLLMLMPIAFFIFWKNRNKGRTKFLYALAGAIGFIVSARVLELAVHIFCIVLDNPVSRFINGNTAAYVIYGITMAGVFEECGRYVILRFIMKKDRTRENSVMYGIGHGGIEVLTVVLPQAVLYIVITVMFSSMPRPEALAALEITEETAAAALPSVMLAAGFGCKDMFIMVLERFLAMLIHIGLTVIVYCGVELGKKKYLLFAVLLHMVCDIFAALYQRGAVSDIVSEIWFIAWTVVISVIAVKLYRRLSPAVSPSDAAETA